RRSPAQPPRPGQADLAEFVERAAFAEVLELEHPAHLDLAVRAVERRIGELPAPLDGLFTGFDVDDRVAGDEFLGLGERTVDDGPVGAAIAHAPPLRRRLEPGA